MTISARDSGSHRRVYRRFALTPSRSEQLKRLARIRRVSESEVVEKALDVFFSLADFFEDERTDVAWGLLSEESLRRVWENEADASYDEWRTLYGVHEG